MAFQSLTEKLKNAFKRFRNKGKLSANDVKEGMREIKLALLEADVSFKVVKDFIKNKLGVATNNDINSYKGKNKENRLVVRVKSTNYMLGKTPYTLLKDDTSPKYYALPQFTSIKGVVLTKEMPLNFTFKTNMVKRTLPTQDGKTVYLLSQEAINYISPIMSGNQTRDF
jgi:hypothetical protein